MCSLSSSILLIVMKLLNSTSSHGWVQACANGRMRERERERQRERERDRERERERERLFIDGYGWVIYYFVWWDEGETKAKRGPSPKLYITVLLLFDSHVLLEGHSLMSS